MRIALTEVQKDPAFLIIKQRIPADFQAKLFEHTRKLKEEQAQGFTPDSHDGKRYFVRWRGRGRKSGTNLFSVDRDGRSESSRRLSTGAGLMRRAGSKNTRGISRELLGDDSEIHKVHGERQNLGGGRGAQDAELELHDDNGAEARPQAASRPSQEHGQENMGSGDSKDDGDSKVRNDMVASDDVQSSHGRETSTNPVISRIKAMETVLLYRAMLFACLLATGTDTSDLLWLENRNRVVQVL